MKTGYDSTETVRIIKLIVSKTRLRTVAEYFYYLILCPFNEGFTRKLFMLKIQFLEFATDQFLRVGVM